MNKLLIIKLLMLTPFFLAGQSKNIEAESRKILGAEISGYKLRMEEEQSLVESLWSEYAKDYGRPDKTRGYLAYECNPWQGEKKYVIYQQISKKPGHLVLWLGLEPEKVNRAEYDSVSFMLEDLLYEFERKVQIYHIQKAINEAEQATAYLSKQFDQLKKDERSTQKDQELNHQRLEKYKRDVITLQTDSAKLHNKLLQLSTNIDSVYKEMEQLKKILEMQKERLKGIE